MPEQLNQPTTVTRKVQYHHRDIMLEGVLALNPIATSARPAVLVLHGWEGLSQGHIDFAKTLAVWGYAGFAVDLYGKGVTGASPGECQKLMMPFMNDRSMLQDRLRHVIDVVKGLPEVEASRRAAIGFCFGGLCALDLARTGGDVGGIASFHGVLTPPGNTEGFQVKTKVIVFHGWEDPFAPPEDLVALGRELTTAGADWQVHVYGKTMHAFMMPTANNPEAGLMYNGDSARRALSSLKSFLLESLGS
jgi:dienelactone hydrolase